VGKEDQVACLVNRCIAQFELHRKMLRRLLIGRRVAAVEGKIFSRG
jgi:invasion protein IalB